MGRVILDLSVSVDGYVAGPNVGVDNPLGDGGDRLHDWMYAKATDVGRTVEREIFDSAGAIVMGRRTFDVGKRYWDPDPQTFRRLPVFVLTRRARTPVTDPGGSTFTFVTDGVDSALAQAHAAAGDRDIVLGGGGTLGRLFLQARLVNELRLHLVHRLLRGGTRLFDLDDGQPDPLRMTRLLEDADVTHLRFTAATRPT